MQDPTLAPWVNIRLNNPRRSSCTSRWTRRRTIATHMVSANAVSPPCILTARNSAEPSISDRAANCQNRWSRSVGTTGRLQLEYRRLQIGLASQTSPKLIAGPICGRIERRRLVRAEVSQQVDRSAGGHEAIDPAKGYPLRRSKVQNIELVTKNENFGLQRRPRPD
jgi:hypothetical protein